MLNVELKDYDDLLIEQKESPAMEKLKKIKSLHEKYRGYKNIYEEDPSMKSFITGTEMNELIDSGMFKNPTNEDSHLHGMVNNLFHNRVQDLDTLKAQTKILLGHDYDISNQNIEKHLYSACQHGHFEYVKDLIENPKMAHIFLNGEQAEARKNDQSLSWFKREQAGMTVKNNLVRASAQGLEDSAIAKNYNSTLAGLAIQSISSQTPNDLAETIVSKNPSVLPAVIGKCQFYNQQTFANFLGQPEVFNVLNPSCVNFLANEQTKRMSERDNKSFDFPVAMVLMKNEVNRSHKQNLVDTAIVNKNTVFLSNVAKQTEYRFDKDQLEALRENKQVFGDVLHEADKKELHDKLTSTMKPKHKVKAMKI